MWEGCGELVGVKKKTSLTLVFAGHNIIVTGRGTINCTDTTIFGILEGILKRMN